jgi:hypothetical protein
MTVTSIVLSSLRQGELLDELGRASVSPELAGATVLRAEARYRRPARRPRVRIVRFVRSRRKRSTIFIELCTGRAVGRRAS